MNQDGNTATEAPHAVVGEMRVPLRGYGETSVHIPNRKSKESALECPVCRDPYSQVHWPMVFPCGHSTCNPCVNKMARIGEPYEVQTVRCPTCNIVADPNKIVPNWAIISSKGWTVEWTKRNNPAEKRRKIPSLNEQADAHDRRCDQTIDEIHGTDIPLLVAFLTRNAFKTKRIFDTTWTYEFTDKEALDFRKEMVTDDDPDYARLWVFNLLSIFALISKFPRATTCVTTLTRIGSDRYIAACNNTIRQVEVVLDRRGTGPFGRYRQAPQQQDRAIPTRLNRPNNTEPEVEIATYHGGFPEDGVVSLIASNAQIDH